MLINMHISVYNLFSTHQVILLGHHPTGSDSSIDYNAYYLTDLLSQYGDIIIFYLLGHNHGDEYRLVLYHTFL